jgi:hypothetical protein
MKTKLPALIITCLLVFSLTGFKRSIPVLKSKPTEKVFSDTTITLPTNAILLHAKRTDTAQGYLWSQVSGPAEATFTNEGSSKIWIKDLVEGRYQFQLMIVSNKGLTTVHSYFVTVKQGKINKLDLSPADNPYEFGLGIKGSQDYSNPRSPEEPLTAWTINFVPIETRSLLAFDLSSIPQNAIILKANLYLYSDTSPQNGDLVHANSGTHNAILVQQVASPWSSSNLTWFNQPKGLMENSVTIPETNLPFLNVDVNVTGIVKAMVANNANYGFKLSLTNPNIYTSRIFCSSYHPNASNHPRLVVSYVTN